MTTNTEPTTTPRAAVTESGRVVLRCKYLGPTNYRGSRIKVTRWDGGMTATADPNRVTVAWDYSLNIGENYQAAVAAYLEHAEWEGRWTVATCDGGAVAVYTGRMTEGA